MSGYESDCCGADVKWGDICSNCLEHCEVIYIDDYDDEQDGN